MRVIAIDGPAGAGKSTVARALAERLDLEYLDTGAMYRGVAFAALRRGVDPAENDDVARVANDLELDVSEKGVFVDGVDATIEIRGPEVTPRSASSPRIPTSGQRCGAASASGLRSEGEESSRAGTSGQWCSPRPS